MIVTSDEGQPRQIPDMIAEKVPVGWHPLAVRLHRALADEDPSYAVRAIGASMGGLEVRVAAAGRRAARLNMIIMGARRASQGICQHCGEPGQVAHVGPGIRGWWAVTCALCRDRRKAPASHRAWKLVGDDGAPLPAGKTGYQVVVGDQEGALRTFGRLLRMAGWLPVSVDAARTAIVAERTGIRQVWTLTGVAEQRAA